MLEDYKQQGLGIVQQAAEQAQRHQQEMAEKTRQESPRHTPARPG